MHDLGLDASTRRLGDELEDLVHGDEVARVDVLTQAHKLTPRSSIGSTSASLRLSNLLTKLAVPRFELM